MPVPTKRMLAPRWSRSLGTGLILLALWVQALAPVAVLRMTLAAPAWMPGAILCGHAPGSAERGVSLEQPGMPPACALCRLCRAGLSPPPLPAAPILARALRWIAVAWPVPPPSRSEALRRFSGQPRAPPTPA